MNKELIKYEDQIYGQVTDNITLLTKALAESQNMITDLKAIAEEKNRAISQLENDNENNKKLAEELNEELQNKRQALEAIETDRAMLAEMKINALKLSELINDEKEKIEQLDIEKAEYKEAKDALVSENEKLKSDLEGEQKKYSKLEQEYNKSVVKCRNDIEKKNEEINTFMSKIDKLEGDKKGLEYDKNVLIQKVDKLEKEINILSDPNQNEKCKSLKNDLNNLQGTIENLQNDIKWLIGYAKATDDKVKKFYKGDKNDLNEHNNWLCNKLKDNNFIKFFGNNIPKDELKNDKQTSVSDQSEQDNLVEQKKTHQKVDRGLA